MTGRNEKEREHDSKKSKESQSLRRYRLVAGLGDDVGLGHLVDFVLGLIEVGDQVDGVGAGDPVLGLGEVSLGRPEADDHVNLGVAGVNPFAKVACMSDGRGGHGRNTHDVGLGLIHHLHHLAGQ